jgi:hypothetical protein
MLAQTCHIIAVEARLAKQFVTDGYAERTDALFLEVYRLLHDPAQSCPEWPWLLLENSESMLRQHRLADASQCFHSAEAIAPEALKPYLKLRMAQTAIDPKVRKQTLREAYLAGGDGLFQAAKADAELADVKAKGLSRDDRRGVRVRCGPGPELSHMRCVVAACLLTLPICDRPVPRTLANKR